MSTTDNVVSLQEYRERKAQMTCVVIVDDCSGDYLDTIDGCVDDKGLWDSLRRALCEDGEAV